MDLTLLVKAAREQGLDTHFYTFYGNSLGAPAALGDVGVKHVLAVADWHPNVGGSASDAYYAVFRTRFPAAVDDYLFLRMPLMIEMLAQAMEKAHNADPTAVARALEGMKLDKGFQTTEMRAADHQLIQPLYVMEVDKVGTLGVHFDNEGSDFGFRTLLKIPVVQTVMPTTCQMKLKTTPSWAQDYCIISPVVPNRVDGGSTAKTAIYYNSRLAVLGDGCRTPSGKRIRG